MDEIDWKSLGLREDLVKLIEEAGFKTPTPVQAKSIPEAMDGLDLIVSAQTGTGKTAAFVFPILERVIGRNGTCALILVPTREIANQTQAVLSQFGAPMGVHSVSLIGGTDLKVDAEQLRNYPQVIVATPGRLCDHLERGNVWLEFLEILVLDEADRMLEMGFSEQLHRILNVTPETRQTLLFSATLSATVERLANKILYQPVRIQVGKPSRAAITVKQEFIHTEEAGKLRLLENLLYDDPGTTIVFTRSKDCAARLGRSLRNRGFMEATQLHSNLSQAVREQALQDFKEGKYRVLIATDVVGRGIHVDDVAHVINYDFPREVEDYIHRVGRTGRAESLGRATSFVTQRDLRTLKDVEKMLGRSIAGPKPSQPQKRAPSRKVTPARKTDSPPVKTTPWKLKSES